MIGTFKTFFPLSWKGEPTLFITLLSPMQLSLASWRDWNSSKVPLHHAWNTADTSETYRIRCWKSQQRPNATRKVEDKQFFKNTVTCATASRSICCKSLVAVLAAFWVMAFVFSSVIRLLIDCLPNLPKCSLTLLQSPTSALAVPSRMKVAWTKERVIFEIINSNKTDIWPALQEGPPPVVCHSFWALQWCYYSSPLSASSIFAIFLKCEAEIAQLKTVHYPWLLGAERPVLPHRPLLSISVQV